MAIHTYCQDKPGFETEYSEMVLDELAVVDVFCQANAAVVPPKSEHERNPVLRKETNDGGRHQRHWCEWWLWIAGLTAHFHAQPRGSGGRMQLLHRRHIRL